MGEIRRSVFLSHTNKDFDLIEKTADYLEANGIPCWYAPRNIPYGQNYNTRIATDIENVEVVLVFITENVGASTYVPKEVSLAIDYKRTLIPILVDGSAIPKTLELFLCNVQWINKLAYETEDEFLDSLSVILEDIYQGTAEEHEARHMVKQPVVLKDSAQTLLFEPPAHTLLKAEKVFVPPSEIKLLKDQLEEQHLLYLHHPHHVGKYTSALALFREKGIHELYEWSKESSFSKVLHHPVKKGAGFLAEIAVEADFFKGLNEYELEAYVEKLKERQTYLVLIGKEEPLQLMQPYAAAIQPPAHVDQLLQNHVYWLEKDESLQKKMVQWLASSEGKEAIPERLLPREAGPYIQKVRKLVLGESNKKELIESLDRNVKERVRVWFKQSYSLRDVAFYLALSIFEGSTYPVMVEKSRQLLNLLQQHLGKEVVYEETMVGRDEYLSQFHAHVKSIWKHTDVGAEEIDAVTFFFPEDVPVIWEFIWTQYPMYQQPLVQWLQQLLLEYSQQLDKRIKRLLVHLLKKDSIAVRNKIILPWANSVKPKERLFAARILQELAMDEDRTHFVFNLTKSWISLRNNERLQWTGVVLLGTELCVSYYPQSMRLLRKVYEMSEGKVAFSVQRSFESVSRTALYGTDYETLYFRFWNEWFKETDYKTLHEAVRFAQSVFSQSPQVFFQTDVKWNDVFWIKLIRISMTNLITRKALEGMLEAWVVFAARNSDLRDRLAQLLYSVYELEGQRVQDYLVRFINRGVQRQKAMYLPIYERLMKM